jgi:BolA protein
MIIEATIIAKLQAIFAPQFLQVINQSHQHQGGLDLESHFKVVLICTHFSGQSRLSRHRAVYQALKPLLKPLGPLHALSLHTYSEQEWLQCSGSPPASPHCARST